ncbi:MAG: FAD:protein FMN transferase [Bacillota bacterium]|nr:FAD:protein FMN transferase [Bacillota bacterium]
MQKNRRIIGILLIISLLTLLSGGCSAELPLTRFSGEFLELFDTVTQVVGYAPTKEAFEQVVSDLRAELRIYHQLFDIYHDYEGLVNLKTLNDHAGGDPLVVDSRIIELLAFCERMYRETDGVVNYAYGAVLRQWHDAREFAVDNPDSAKIPLPDDLIAASHHTDPSTVRIDVASSTVQITDPDVRLDVGAIAKGYAVEQVARSIERKYPGMPLLIGVGGNIRAIGFKDPQKLLPWSVGIQNPDPDAEPAVLKSLNLVGQSMVTSGDYQRYFTVDGVKYHHIIDPATHMPANHYRSVTILTDDSGRADALSTAAYILPFEQAKALIEGQEGAEAFFVLSDGSQVWTAGLEAFFRN